MPPSGTPGKAKGLPVGSPFFLCDVSAPLFEATIFATGWQAFSCHGVFLLRVPTRFAPCVPDERFASRPLPHDQRSQQRPADQDDGLSPDLSRAGDERTQVHTASGFLVADSPQVQPLPLSKYHAATRAAQIKRWFFVMVIFV